MDCEGDDSMEAATAAASAAEKHHLCVLHGMTARTNSNNSSLKREAKTTTWNGLGLLA
jgi:hypothetical protein